MMNTLPTPLKKSQIDPIRQAMRRIVRELGFMQDHLAGTKLSASAVHTIVELGNHTVSNSTDLAKLLQLEKSSISRMLAKLKQDDVITVKTSPHDKRIQTLILTPRGTALFHQIETYARDRLVLALAPLSAVQFSTLQDGVSIFANALTDHPASAAPLNSTVCFHEGYRPGLIGHVTEHHMKYYAQHYGFGAIFERKVAAQMSEFIGRIEHPINQVFSAYQGQEFLGSVSMDGQDLGDGRNLGDGENLGHNMCHLRWFIVSAKARGKGVGKALINQAVQFADARNFAQTELWTFKGLDAARHLYEQSGFVLEQEIQGTQWGAKMTEQIFRRAHPNGRSRP